MHRPPLFTLYYLIPSVLLKVSMMNSHKGAPYDYSGEMLSEVVWSYLQWHMDCLEGSFADLRWGEWMHKLDFHPKVQLSYSVMEPTVCALTPHKHLSTQWQMHSHTHTHRIKCNLLHIQSVFVIYTFSVQWHTLSLSLCMHRLSKPHWFQCRVNKGAFVRRGGQSGTRMNVPSICNR